MERATKHAAAKHDWRKEKQKKAPPRQGSAVVEIDQAVLLFLDEERTEGRVVRNKDLRQKANEIAGGLGLQDFSASPMWLKRWKQRHSVCTRRSTHASQKVPDDFEELLFNFRVSILRLRNRHHYPLRFIQNMDQTMVRFDMVPSRTNERKGVKQVRVKTTNAQKRGFTVALYASADGVKYPATIVLKERNGHIPQRAFRNLQIPANVRIQATRNGWMTRESLQVWVEQVVGEMDDRRLLVLDSYRAHQTPQIRQALNERHVDVVFVPPGCTGLAQPVDIGIAKTFKDRVRDQWVQWMRQPRPLTAAGNLTQPSRQNVITWVSQAWEGVPEETIRTCFIRCAISNAMDGSEDDQALEWFPNEMDGILLQEAAEEERDEESSSDDEEEADGFGFFE